MKEIWKYIDGYEGLYKISNLGKVKSLTTRGGKKPRIMKQQSRNGYLRVPLTDNNGNKSYKSVHRIVAKHFCKGFGDKMEINHKDGNKSNNNYKNLEWVTRSQNQTHAFNNGLQIPINGSDIGNSKLCREDILQIRSIYEQGWATYQEIAEAYKVTKQNIYCIIKGKTWGHV